MEKRSDRERLECGIDDFPVLEPRQQLRDEGFEPWASDGTAAGTVPLGDLAPPGASSIPFESVVVDRHLVFLVEAADSTLALWASDGTAAGTKLLGELQNGDGGSDISDATYLLNHLFLGGPAPVEPNPNCGPGTLPTDEETCETRPKNCP